MDGCGWGRRGCGRRRPGQGGPGGDRAQSSAAGEQAGTTSGQGQTGSAIATRSASWRTLHPTGGAQQLHCRPDAVGSQRCRPPTERARQCTLWVNQHRRHGWVQALESARMEASMHKDLNGASQTVMPAAACCFSCAYRDSRACLHAHIVCGSGHTVCCWLLRAIRVCREHARGYGDCARLSGEPQICGLRCGVLFAGIAHSISACMLARRHPPASQPANLPGTQAMGGVKTPLRWLLLQSAL